MSSTETRGDRNGTLQPRAAATPITPRRTLAGATIGLVMLATFALAHPASAWTAYVADESLIIEGTNDTDVLEVDVEADQIRVRDPEYPEKAVFFPSDGIVDIRATLLDAPDSFRSTVDLPVYVSGGHGYDTLTTGGGDDLLDGGEGDDRLHGGSGNDVIYGGDGADILHGDDGDDLIYGYLLPPYADGSYQDADLIYGGPGDDVIFGGPDDDEIHAGAGNDVAHGYSDDSENVVLYEGSGQDVDWISGGDGDDTLDGGPRDDFILGNRGNDTIGGGTGSDWLSGGQGDDLVIGGAESDTIMGDSGADTLVGGSGSDHLLGGLGADVLIAGTSIHGPWPEDASLSIGGSDVLEGDEGDDHLIGGDGGVDILWGGEGDDLLITVDGATDDILYGEAGFDSFWVDGEEGWERLYDATTQEEETNVHWVAEFSNDADMSFDGDDLSDPADGSAYQNFGQNPLFPIGGPTRTDVNQGGVGDCWLLAALASVANARPEAIRQTIVPLHDGTFLVEYDGKHYRVDADLPMTDLDGDGVVDQLAYAGLGAQQALWVALIEKAVAFDRFGWSAFWKPDLYDDTEFGRPRAALKALGGDPRGFFEWLTDVMTSWSAKRVLEDIDAALGENDALAYCTSITDGIVFPNRMVAFHCYSIVNVTYDSDGKPDGMNMYNPWGIDGGDAPDANPGDGFIWVSKGEFKRSFPFGWEEFAISSANFQHFLESE